MQGNGTQGGGLVKREVDDKKPKPQKKPKNNQFILFIQEKWISFIIGGAGSLLVWLLCNLVNNQILIPLNELRNEKIQKIENLEENYHELDKRIIVLESSQPKPYPITAQTHSF
jgi:hypothetical protein